MAATQPRQKLVVQRSVKPSIKLPHSFIETNKELLRRREEVDRILETYPARSFQRDSGYLNIMATAVFYSIGWGEPMFTKVFPGMNIDDAGKMEQLLHEIIVISRRNANAIEQRDGDDGVNTEQNFHDMVYLNRI